MSIGDQKTILLVEDEAIIALAEKAILEKQGFKVVTALTGESALEIAEAASDIDLILMDIDLGRGVDGTEAAAKILGKRDLPLIFLSSHTEPAVVEKTEGITSYGYIVKNSGETVLIASIKMAFRLFESRIKERQNREALRASEERFVHLFERAPLGYQSLDENGFFIEVNEAWLETLGYDRDEVIGKWFGDFLAPEFVPCFRENFAKFKQAGRIHSEFEMLHKSGQRKYIAFDGRIGKKRDGSFEKTHCILQDVTDKRRMEEKLKTSDRIFEHSLDMLCIAGFDGYFKVLNPAWEKTLGWSTAELLEKPWVDFVHPEDKHATDDIKTGIVDGQEVYQFENRYLCKNGEVKWLSWNSFPYPEENIMFGVARDITEKKRAEEELKNRELLLNKIFDVLPIGLWFADKEGTLLRGNPAGIKIWGAEPKVSPADYGVFKARSLTSGKELAPEDWALARTIREGVTVEDELLEIEAFDGKKKIILNYTAPVIDDNGKVLGAVIINNDITDRKTGEIALREKENNFRTVAENAGVGITVIQDNAVRYINGTAAEIGGFSLDEMSTLRMEDLLERIHPDDKQIITEKYLEQRKNLRTYAEQRKVFAPIEYRHIRKNGSIVWTEAVSSAIYYDGEPALLVIHNGISERRRSSESFGGIPASGQASHPAL